MDLRNYLRTLRKSWLLIAVSLLVCLGGAVAVVKSSQPVYAASAQLFVAARDSAGDANGLNAGSQFIQQRVQSYAQIINSPEVAKAAADDLGNVSAAEVQGSVAASAPLNTVLLNVVAQNPSPQKARDIANAVSTNFADYVATLETPQGSTISPVKVTVVKPASGAAQVSPRKNVDLGIGLIAGLALGIAGAFLREALDTSVRDPQQAQKMLGVPVLGAIAYDSEAKRRPLIVTADPQSSRAEAFRSLRTNLQFIDPDSGPRSLVITSSVPEEGKTTTVANLAITLAQSGLKVLLVEADLRRPRLAEYLGVEGAAGLTSILIGKATAEEVVQVWAPEPTLSILASGPTPPNPSELLGSRGMVSLLRELEDTYDLVLLDAPPLLPVTDAAVLGVMASGAIVVVRHGKTKRDQVKRAVESLVAVEATVYGTVLTMTPSRGPEADYYGYGYRYDKDAAEKNGTAEHILPEPASVPVAEEEPRTPMPAPAAVPIATVSRVEPEDELEELDDRSPEDKFWGDQLSRRTGPS